MPRIKNYQFLRFLAWVCVLLIFSSAVYSMALDIGLAEIKDDSWWSLFKREYVANLVTSPLWLVVAVLWNMADVKENGEWKRHKEQILGHIKGKETVEVIHLREIIQNKYDQDKELEAMQEQRVRMAAPVNEAELRL